METLFFSVIIPVLNEEKFLPHLLSDLRNQKVKNFEVIIVDGNSVDQSEAVSQAFKNDYPLRFIKVNKRQVSYQRNFGADQAKGKYLVFLDADTGFDATFFGELTRTINKKGGLIFLPYIYPEEKRTQNEIIFKTVNLLIEASQHSGKPFSSGGSMIVEKNFFKLIGGFDEKLFMAEDHNFVQRAHAWGVRARMLKKISIKFSLRRMKKEGRLVFLYKNLLATAHVLVRGKINNKIFAYEMGGSGYQPKENRVRVAISQIKKYYEQFNLFFNKLLAED